MKDPLLRNAGVFSVCGGTFSRNFFPAKLQSLK